MFRNFYTQARLTTLINDAQTTAMQKVEGRPATTSTLELLASQVRFAILRQVALGEWCDFGIEEPSTLMRLHVTARLGRSLNEPPIVVEYDFSKTDRPDICVESVPQ